jgi:hypothetical protein
MLCGTKHWFKIDSILNWFLGKKLVEYNLGCYLGWYIVVTYEIRVFFEGAEKEVFSSIFLKKL